MAVLADFVFLNSSSTVTTSNTFYVPYGASEVVLQVTGNSTIDVTIQGKVDTENGDFVTLSVINHTGFETSEKIEAEGIYSVMASGIRQIQAVNAQSAGSVTVYGAAVN